MGLEPSTLVVINTPFPHLNSDLRLDIHNLSLVHDTFLLMNRSC